MSGMDITTTSGGCCSTPEGSPCCAAKPKPKDYMKVLRTPWTITLLVPVLVLLLDRSQALPLSVFAIKAFLSTLPYLIFAVLLIALLKAAGAESAIRRAFEGRETEAIVLAALFGGLAPFCSCQVIPFIAGLLAVGTPLSAVMAFWLSSPLIDPPTLLITAAALGWPFAIGKAVAAVALGLFGGFAVKMMLAGGAFATPLKQVGSGGCGCGPSGFRGKPVWRFWQEGQRRAVFSQELKLNALFLIKWLALAYVLEAVLVTYVPAELIARTVGGEGVVPIVAAAIVGMPAYLNSYVAPPLLAGLIEQGMSTGAAMAFMIAGAVSSIPAMAAVWSLVRPLVFATYLGLGIFGAVIAGVIFQYIV
ncbi:permease [Roseibium sp.]|uniref:permease n=1 Tax=Roseibium sp. TaxID=1936156 RepID=UPI003A974D30